MDTPSTDLLDRLLQPVFLKPVGYMGTGMILCVSFLFHLITGSSATILKFSMDGVAFREPSKFLAVAGDKGFFFRLGPALDLEFSPHRLRF